MEEWEKEKKKLVLGEKRRQEEWTQRQLRISPVRPDKWINMGWVFASCKITHFDLVIREPLPASELTILPLAAISMGDTIFYPLTADNLGERFQIQPPGHSKQRGSCLVFSSILDSTLSFTGTLLPRLGYFLLLCLWCAVYMNCRASVFSCSLPFSLRKPSPPQIQPAPRLIRCPFYFHKVLYKSLSATHYPSYPWGDYLSQQIIPFLFYLCKSNA